MTDTVIPRERVISRTAGRPAAPVQKAGRNRLRLLGIQAGIVVLVLALWELASGRFIPALMISAPSQVLPQFASWIADGTLLSSVLVTFQSAGLGILFGGIAGIAVGIVLGQSKLLGEVFEPFITALYTVPKHALIPLFIIWVGIGSSLAVLTASVIVFFLVFFNTFFGISDVRKALVNSVRVMGGSSRDVLRHVRLPSAAIWVVAAMKLAVPQAIVGVVVAEMLAGQQGLGFLVARNAGMFNTKGTFAALLALLIAGFLIDRLMSWVTKKPLEWKKSNSTM